MRISFLSSFILFFVFTSPVNAQSTIVPFYIIIGQSNTGWTSAYGMSSQQAASYGGVTPETEIWNQGYYAGWQPLQIGLNTRCENYNDPLQFGPEASLLKSLQNQQPKKRLVYKQGQGGTTLSVDWRPTAPGEYIYQAGFRWQQFTQWFKAAVAKADEQGYKLDLKGIIWMQGEDDAKTLPDAAAYLLNLGRFFTAIDNIWQGYVSTYGFPNNGYKKVIGRIYAPTGYPYRDIVRAAQYDYCANAANNAIMINCDNYPLQDWVHYNASGQIQFGLDIFNAAQFEGSAAPAPVGVTFSGKILLQGAYNSSTGLMSNTLNTSGLLQVNAFAQPYAASYGYAGTETVGPGFFAAHNDIVDWVLIELRNEATPSIVVATRAAFVKRDGTLVDINGSTVAITFQGIAKSKYYVSIRHRNHLGIRSSSVINFNSGTATYDFTTSAAKSYQSLAYSSTVQLGNVWALRGGNANVNSNTKYNGPQNDQDRIQNLALGGSISAIISNVYANDDVNMDGKTKTNGPANDQNFLLNIILGGVIGNIYNEQL